MSKPALVVFREVDRLGPYQTALAAARVDAVYCQPSDAPELEQCSGLVLTGGTDVNPRLYGEEPVPETDPPDSERDEREIALLRRALDLGMPIFGICRGLQMMNVCFGGSLVQHLPNVDEHRVRGEDKSQPVHAVQVEPDSVLARVAGPGPLNVNSRHHQAVARLGTGLRVTARSADGVVEAVELPDERFVVAVQWHPEDQVFRFPEQLALFTAFRDAVNFCEVQI